MTSSCGPGRPTPHERNMEMPDYGPRRVDVGCGMMDAGGGLKKLCYVSDRFGCGVYAWPLERARRTAGHPQRPYFCDRVLGVWGGPRRSAETDNWVETMPCFKPRDVKPNKRIGGARRLAADGFRAQRLYGQSRTTCRHQGSSVTLGVGTTTN